MATYFKDEQKKERWESGQAVLHKENAQNDSAEKKRGIKNSYGRLQYMKKGEKRKEEKEGFSLEAFEAPGTPLHTEKEKHIERTSMKRITHGINQNLFSSELPLRNQALFYDLTDTRESKDFLDCMKYLLHTRGHQTLNDTFGFLDQETDRRELKLLKEEQKEHVSEGLDYENNLSFTNLSFTDENRNAYSKRMDTLNSRLLRKEAKERQLCTDLQLMLNQQTKEEYQENLSGHIHNEPEHGQKPEKTKNHDSIMQRLLQSGGEAAGNQTEGEPVMPEEEDSF